MKFDPATSAISIPTANEPRAEDLFLPAIEEVVKHMARMAAEADYKHFIETGRIPYAEPTGTEGSE